MKVHSLHQSSLRHSVNFDKCIMSRIYPASITGNPRTGLKTPCALHIPFFFPPSQPLATTDLFTVPIVVPFPE